VNATDAIKYLHNNAECKAQNMPLLPTRFPSPDSHSVLIIGKGLTHMSGANLLQLLLQLKQMRQPVYSDWHGAFEKQGRGSRGYDRQQPDV
jgi:hypothetical protein